MRVEYARLTKRALDAGDSAAISGSFLASSFVCSQALSTPAPTPVTLTVGCLVKNKMSKVFLSWYDGHNHGSANEFLELLNRHGFDVDHSPFSPQSGLDDERWKTWYKEGLPEAISQAEIFIAVITPACDGSTWMLQEFQEAYTSLTKTGKPKLCYIRFDSIEKTVKYPEYYLEDSAHLSSIPEEAVRELLTFNL